MVVGNILIGSRYVEPQGTASVACEETGTTSEMEFKERGWITNDDELNYVKAVIKDKDGIETYTIEGKFTEKLYAENL